MLVCNKQRFLGHPITRQITLHGIEDQDACSDPATVYMALLVSYRDYQCDRQCRNVQLAQQMLKQGNHEQTQNLLCPFFGIIQSLSRYEYLALSLA